MAAVKEDSQKKEEKEGNKNIERGQAHIQSHLTTLNLQTWTKHTIMVKHFK